MHAALQLPAEHWQQSQPPPSCSASLIWRKTLRLPGILTGSCLWLAFSGYTRHVK